MLFGKYVNKFYVKYALFFILGLISLLIVNYFQLLFPGILGGVVDGIADGSLLEDQEQIMAIVQTLIMITIVMFITRFLWRYFIIGTSAKIEADLRHDMFLHSEKLGQTYYKDNTTGSLMALFSNDVSAVRQMYGFGMVAIIDIIFLTLMTFYQMFTRNAILALVSIIPVLLIWVLSILVGKVMTLKVKARQEAFENLSDFSFETLSGINVIKAFVKEVFEAKQFLKANRENQEKTLSFVRFSLLLDVAIGAIQTSVIVLILGIGSYLVFNDTLSTGDLVAFTFYFGTLTWPMMAVGFLMNFSTQAKASYKRIENFLDQEVEIVDNVDILNKDEFEGKIEFKNLSFAYPDSPELVLKNVSFTINKGELVGIIGKTGSGKTTIVDLLLRLYNLEDNSLFIDDIDIMKLPFKQVRNNVGYVPQDNFLFSDTITNNIAFSHDFEKDIEEQSIRKAASLAILDSNISDFENKYDTILGERGVTLSGGQKQRLSIARAFLKDPCVLIFDDSVSAVDTNTEKKILKNIRAHRQGKTTILIAHRISTVSQLDKIIVMDSGSVMGVGSHEYLEKNLELYRQMIKEQALEKEISGDLNNEKI